MVTSPYRNKRRAALHAPSRTARKATTLGPTIYDYQETPVEHRWQHALSGQIQLSDDFFEFGNIAD